jgi:hypothetical protein
MYQPAKTPMLSRRSAAPRPAKDSTHRRRRPWQHRRASQRAGQGQDRWGVLFQQRPWAGWGSCAEITSYPDAYAQWAGDVTDLLGPNLRVLAGPDSEGSTINVADCQEDTANPSTVGTLNLLGAGHTDGKPGGGEKAGY